MKCPKCNSSELDPAGICPACDFQGETVRPSPENQEELPPWRIELSRRLQAIKEKRGDEEKQPESEHAKLPFDRPVESAPGEPEPRGETPVVPPKPPRAAARSTAARPLSADRLLKARPVAEPAADRPIRVPADSESAGGANVMLRPASIQAASGSGEVRHLIDDVISMRSSPGQVVRASAPAAISTDQDSAGENKLILLSRTLSGMIDLLAVFLCTVALVVAEDVFSGIEIFDQFSFINAAAVFLTTYFLYSLFFLGTANQTIGMTITHLRLVAENGARPSFGRIVSRCVLFILSAAVLCVGLLWGCFDPDSRCLHDHLSGTRIEPLLPAL